MTTTTATGAHQWVLAPPVLGIAMVVAVHVAQRRRAQRRGETPSFWRARLITVPVALTWVLICLAVVKVTN